MSQERKPSDDLKEGLGLIFRAAKTAARQVDIAKLDKSLDRAVTEVGRVVSRVGRVVADEVNRIASSPPPWSQSDPATGDPPKADEGEGDVKASETSDQATPGNPGGGGAEPPKSG
jgi:hypothetical protein